jgi:hypothetical protein
MDEFLVVEFDEDRGVIINGTMEEDWRTNQTIPLEVGTYIIKLVSPWDYTPGEIRLVLRNTNLPNPEIIKFRRKGVPL